MARSWIEVRVETPSSLVEGISNFLIELGSPGVAQESLSGPKRERIIAYFPNTGSFPFRKKKIRSFLSSLSRPSKTFSLGHRVIREEKWAEAWKSHFRPLQATPRLVIKPPWERYPRKKGEVVIDINPGMAFGTGTHPTTQLCLRALENLIPAFPYPPTVLDVGTGSGILSIAAHKLGARKIVAVDLDPVAIESARENARANGVQEGIDFRIGSLGGVMRRFDIVVANLLPQEILKIAPSLVRRVSSEGFLVVSGILSVQKKEIAGIFREASLKIRRSEESRGWACLTLKKPGAETKKQRVERMQRRARSKEHRV